MKFIITENRIINLLEKTFNNIIKSEEYDWVDSIQVKVSSTADIGWNLDFHKPVYSYVINLKDNDIPDYKIQSKLFDSISTYHNLIFPNTEGNKPSAYFNTSSKLPDGSEKSFPIHRI
jgi:hypothetical protein